MKQKIENVFTAKITTRVISFVLSLLILFFAVPEIIYAETIDAVSSANFSASSETVTDGEDLSGGIYTYNTDIYEIEELREENVKHFRLEDGSYVAAQYPTAVHIADSNGKWVDIDNTLHSVSSDFSTSDSRIKFSKKITGNSSLFTLHNGNTKITMSLIGAVKGTVGTVTNGTDAEELTKLQKMMNLEKLSSKVIYKDILSGVDIEYVTNGGGIKENIIIKERAAAYSYSFSLNLNGQIGRAHV